MRAPFAATVLVLFGLTLVASPSLTSAVTAPDKKPAVVKAGDKKVSWLAFDAAAEQAKKENKHMIVDVYTTWCGWCRICARRRAWRWMTVSPSIWGPRTRRKGKRSRRTVTTSPATEIVGRGCESNFFASSSLLATTCLWARTLIVLSSEALTMMPPRSDTTCKLALTGKACF